MFITLIISVIVVFILFLAFVSFKALFARNWFLKWVRGTTGFIAITLVVFGVLLTFDLVSYNGAKHEKPIATLTFVKKSNQLYRVELIDAKGELSSYEVAGDQWQLDVKLISAQSIVSGALPAYKLDRISGRYLSLEQERTDIRSAHALSDGSFPDVWKIFSEVNILGIRAKYGSATYMPMADGAIFRVNIVEDGLLPIPVNTQAKLAVESW